MLWYIICQRFSIGFRSVEREGQSPMSSSYRNQCEFSKQWYCGFIPGIQLQQRYRWRGCGFLFNLPSILLPRPSLTTTKPASGENNWLWPKPFPFWCWSCCSLSCAPIITFICTKAAKTDSQSFTLPKWTGWYHWSLNDLTYIVMILCSLNFF